MTDPNQSREPVNPAGGAESDDMLLDRAVDGDAEALGRLVDRHAAMTYAIALPILGDPDLAMEAVSRAFLAVTKGRARGQVERGSIRPALLASARARSIEIRRGSLPAGMTGPSTPKSPEDGTGAAKPTPPAVGTPDGPTHRSAPLTSPPVRPDQRPGPNPGTGGEGIEAALAGLAPDERMVVDLAYFRGLSSTDIADMLGTTPAEATRRVGAALAALAGAIGVTLDPVPGGRRSMTQALKCEEVRELAGAYVLGSLEPAEMIVVRDHLDTCPEPHPEIVEFGSVVAHLAESVDPISPPPGLRDRILAEAAADVRAGERDDAAAQRLISVLGATAAARPSVAPERTGDAPSTGVSTPGSDSTHGERAASVGATEDSSVPTPITAARPGRGSGTSAGAWVLRIAAVIAILAVAGWGIVQARDLAASRDYAAQVDRALALAAAPDSQVALIRSDAGPSGPRGLAVIPAQGDGVLVMTGLTPTTGSQVYEAWVIAGGTGTPLAIGSFAVPADGRGAVALPATAAGPENVIALTLEPTAGRTTPTLPVVSGGTLGGS